MILSPFIGAGGEWSAANAIALSAAGVTVPIDTVQSSFGGVVDADLVNFDLTFMVPGYYDVSATWVLDQNTTATRGILRAFLQENIAGGGFAIIPAADIYTYTRSAAAGEGSGSVSVTRLYAPGDQVRSRADIHNAAPTCGTLAGMCNISIRYRSPS